MSMNDILKFYAHVNEFEIQELKCAGKCLLFLTKTKKFYANKN